MRQAISRIGIHRSKKLNAIAKKKDDICKHLEAGNEVNAKIWVSSSEFLKLVSRLRLSSMKKTSSLVSTSFQSCAIS